MYKYMYSDSNGNEEIVSFENEKEMYENINEIMQDIYDNLCVAYEDKDVTWLNRLLDVGNVTEIYVLDTNISYSITILDIDECHPISAEAVYTGGNIWIFHGKCSDGNWFLTDDYGYTAILDTDPDKDWDNCLYYEWQQKHLVKDFKEKERTDFSDELADLLHKVDCGLTDDAIEEYREYWRLKL